MSEKSPEFRVPGELPAVAGLENENWMGDDQAGDPLYWDSSYAIAKQLMEIYPEADVADMSLGRLAEWVLALPSFADDPALVNDDLLNAILQEWYEEATPL